MTRTRSAKLCRFDDDDDIKVEDDESHNHGLADDHKPTMYTYTSLLLPFRFKVMMLRMLSGKTCIQVANLMPRIKMRMK